MVFILLRAGSSSTVVRCYGLRRWRHRLCEMDKDANDRSLPSTGEPDDALEIRSLKVVPDPPVPGKKMTIYAEGLAKQRIEVNSRVWCFALL